MKPAPAAHLQGMSIDANGSIHDTRNGRYSVKAAAAPTTTIAQADPLVADLAIAPGDSYMLTPAESGSDILDGVEVVRDDDGHYRAQASMQLDMFDGWLAMYGGGPQDPDELRDEASEWLDEHQQVVTAFLTDRYGLELQDGCDDWENQRAQFSVDLDGPDLHMGEVASRLYDSTAAVKLYNEMDRGTFGSPYLWSELKTRMAAWELEVDDAQRGYVHDVLTDAGTPPGEAFEVVDFMDPARRNEAAAVVRTFMRDHHDTIAQAKRAHQELFGIPHEASTLGRDISLAMHNPADTPHGRLAFASLPTHLQSRLQEHARALV
jgi:hypothetical protein